MNINTITIADYLSHNDMARKALVAQAEAAAKDPKTLNLSYSEAQDQLNSLDLPIGWGNSQQNSQAIAKDNNWWGNYFAPLFGWLLTALAALLSAPFWFDILNKIMVIRSTVKPHEKSKEEASEDRQLLPRPPPRRPPWRSLAQCPRPARTRCRSRPGWLRRGSSR